MPLHRQNKMIGSCAFDCLNNAVVRAASDRAQAIADDFRRLMMAGVDRNQLVSASAPAATIPASLDRASISTVCATGTVRPAS